MTTTGWLRVVAGLLAFFALAHTAGMLAPARDAQETATLTALAAYTFDAMGTPRTHLDFYVGLGWLLTAHLVTLLGVVLWAERRSRKDAASVRGLVAVLGCGLAVTSALCWWKFFAAPAVTCTLATLALWMAWRRA